MLKKLQNKEVPELIISEKEFDSITGSVIVKDYIVHKIGSQDTIDVIVERYNVEKETLQDANKL